MIKSGILKRVVPDNPNAKLEPISPEILEELRRKDILSNEMVRKMEDPNNPDIVNQKRVC